MLRTTTFTALAVLLASTAMADEFVANGKLRAATVYTGRATLTRTATIDLPAGAHTIVFNDLSPNLMPDSLRAEGKASATVTFGALSNKLVAGAELSAPREKELTDKLTGLEDQRNLIAAEKDALAAQLEFLRTLSRSGATRAQENIANIELKPEQWQGASKAILDSTNDVLKAQLTHDVSLRELDKQINQVNTELGQLRTGARNAYRVTIPVEVAAPTQLKLDLSYQIPGATWMPLYDARLDTRTSKLELIQYGAVSQNTGEDWTDIALTLSTAQPTRGAGLPELSPWWVNIFEPTTTYRAAMQEFAVGGSNGMADGSMALPAAPAMRAMKMDDSQEVVLDKAATFVAAQIETGGFVGEYKIVGPSTVKADGTESKLMIGPFQVDSKMQVQVKPQLASDAFLVARATLKGETPILPGNVNLFRDGAFVGQSQLPLLKPGKERDLPFGVDDQVSMEYRILKDERSEVGVISRETTLTRHTLAKLANLHTQPIELVVMQTTPVPQSKQITFKLVDDQTTPNFKMDADDVKGVMRWTLPLKPQEKTDVKLGWALSWPKDQNISGL